MAKKKSKTQKYKQNQKRKNKIQANKVKFVEADQVSYNLPITEPEKFTKKKKTATKKEEAVEEPKKVVRKTTTKKDDIKEELPRLKSTAKKTTTKEPAKKENKTSKRAVVDKDKVVYNVPITNLEKKKKPVKKNNNKRPLPTKPLTRKEKKLLKKQQKEEEYQRKETLKEELKLAKEQKKLKRIELLKKKSIFFRIFFAIKAMIPYLFDLVLVGFIAMTILGLIKTEIFEKGTITYISIIICFLSLIAIAYNKHIEGKLFTILLCTGMGFAIYKINYTYDFINALNIYEYESKTYYVITLDNLTNKSIYNVNNKKVALLKNNHVNVERMLSTKIEATYLEYEDINAMFNDFYEQKFRAVVVTQNEYKYLENNITNKPVKIIYEFKANCKK